MLPEAEWDMKYLNLLQLPQFQGFDVFCPCAMVVKMTIPLSQTLRSVNDRVAETKHTKTSHQLNPGLKGTLFPGGCWLATQTV